MSSPSMVEGPQALRALMAEIGPRWALDLRGNSQRVKDAYAPLLASAPKAGIAVARDLAYGTHARQVMDIFTPADAARAPVVVFVHGGAFVRGDKRASDEIYDNVLYWFARQGCVGVNLEYRLAPEAAYPDGTRDVAQAMAWLKMHVAQHGGDPARMLLVGHSAGGTHVASYAFAPMWAEGCHAQAVVLVSARLRADQLPGNPNAAGVKAYFGDDASLYEQRSPVSFAAHGTLPALIVTAEFENPLLDVYGLEFAHRMAAARGHAPRYLQMKGHNHMSIVAHFNGGEETLGREIMDFFSALAPAG
ncbi:alpha/beta hydrolase [Variovorax sp. PBL-E5]|uniref:alpha/beta hydrolase n=1 Tax=Variovorax sp. PBL-E5 TaxID=434014 RepID=UPI001E46674B|nr:alpha/beta hydrolase [Variovorax sp. PBL-E5]